MRVIKQNTVTYESFHKSLPYLTKSNGPGNSHRFINLDLETKEDKSLVKNLSLVLEFKDNIAKSRTNDQIFVLFEELLKHIINIGEVNIFFHDYDGKLLAPLFPCNIRTDVIFY